jgi:predicted amidophosphoribosyltransferase
MTFKLGGERRAARMMGEYMARAVLDVAADVVTFVPATRRSVSARGFNPAEELARSLARALRIPWAPLLTKVRETTDQAELGRIERRRNVEGAFRARPMKARVLLVDDVMTTGATADACARALRAAGARDVVVVTFARAGD